MVNKRIKIFLSFIITLLYLECAVAQKVTAINHKGTKVSIINNTVTTSETILESPNENDIWFDTTFDPQVVKIFDGTNWINMAHKGKPGSLFYADENGDPSENNDRLFWDSDKDRLGVGTNAPTHRLEVEGTMAAEGIVNSNGSIGRPSYRFKNDIDTGISRLAADELSFIVGGYEALLIDEPTVGVTKVIVNQTLELDGPLLDSSNSPGTSGQVLSATAAGTSWIDHASLSVSPEAGNQITTAADGGVYLGPTTYTGYFIISPPTTTGVSISETQLVDDLPFEPSQITFTARANVESESINASETILPNDINSSYGTSYGFARKNSDDSFLQQFGYSGGAGSSTLSNVISRYAIPGHCLGIRYSSSDGESLGTINAKVLDFNSLGFTLEVNYSQGVDITSVDRNQVFNESLLVLYTAYR
ncbi:hypothetical protein [Flavobacterium frigidarium]|uniref:hypothetical protein n=1 Tax=Flavobacterium frigidarium TaxID=99286 RepID=UPI00352F2AFD